MADPGVDLVHVVEIAEGEDARQVDARQRRPHRRRPGRQHQGVVGLAADGARLNILDFDRPAAAVDAADFVPGADLDAEEVAEPLGRGDQQLPPLGDRAAEVIRQAAVGERDVAAPLENVDFGVFIQAAEPGRARSAPATPPTIRTRFEDMMADSEVR